MKHINCGLKALTIAAVLFLGASASYAFPNASPYACTYQLQNGTTGVALVTFALGPGNLQRSGSIKNLYPTTNPPYENSTVKPVTITADIQLGGYFFHQTQDNITCHIEVQAGGRQVVFSQCSNGNRQDCRQWW